LSLIASGRRPGSAATRAVAREIRDIAQQTLVRTAWR
jgi:hypothetical protein